MPLHINRLQLAASLQFYRQPPPGEWRQEEEEDENQIDDPGIPGSRKPVSAAAILCRRPLRIRPRAGRRGGRSARAACVLCSRRPAARVGGYWYPAGPHYAWHAGYWARPAFAGTRWYAPRYYGGHYYGGYWRR